jgi:methylenetetrahydrofolate reductase (NADPH)
MSDYLVEARPALTRWLAGERIGPLPMRGADQEPPELSFEFFPPRTEALERQLWTCIRRLAPLSPRFASVTYGAGGTTHARTHATVARLVQDTDLTPAAHLTCVGATREEVDEVARGYWEAGIRHIVALRGDPPPGVNYTPHPGGYHYASDLVAGLRRVADFEISIAAYPETHPAASSAEDDLDNLKRKLDAGATRAITQYFFDTST